jgi:prepilin-type N-terminal cleavage/methylation domain-containing protein
MQRGHLQMLRKLQQIREEKDDGFTIIEVLIVLAIAALIMVIVLVAIPQLQRNQRNTARKEIVGRLNTEIGNYSGNNNGAIPTNAAELTIYVNRYLNGVNRNDPSTGTAITPTMDGSTTAGAANAAAPLGNGVALYRNGYTCTGETISAGTARQYAIWVSLEGGARYCLSGG